MNPPGERSNARLQRLRAWLAQRAKDHPVKPKRISGPFPAGDQRHQEEGQVEMVAGVLGARCAGCGGRIVRGTGELIEGLWCGRCYANRELPDDAA